MVVGVVVSSFAQCGRADRFSQAGQMGGSTNPVAVIGNTTLTERVMQSEIEQAAQMYGGNLDQLPPELQLTVRASIVKSVVGYANLLEVAKKYGVSVSDDDILKQLEGAAKDEFARLKMQLVQMKKLKENATEAEFEAAYEQVTGHSIDEAKEKALSIQKERLHNPDTRVPLEALSLSQPLLEAIKKTINVTDDEVKKSYDKFVFKSISITKGDVDSIAKKAEADIKGGLSFEAAIDRYSDAKPMDPKKKLHDETMPIPWSNLVHTVPQFDYLKPLANLRPGQVSEPIKSGSGVTIYKLIEVKSDLPKDFEKNKAQNKDSYVTTLASTKLQTELAEAEKNAKIEWKDKIYKGLYDYAKLQSEPAADKPARLLDILTEVVAGMKEGTSDSTRLGNQFAYGLYLQLQREGTPAQKAKLDALKFDVIRGYLQDSESATLRMELVKAYFEKKDKDGFYEELSGAANANLSSTDTAAQSVYNEINKYLRQGQDAKLLTAEEAKQIEDVQRMWVDAKAEQDKYDAEAKKQAEEEKKKNVPAAKSREDFEKEKAAKEKAGASKPKGK